MLATVYLVSTGGKMAKETFGEDKEASNYAKSQSKAHSNYCTVYHTINNKVFFYENGDLVNASRKKELSKGIEEMSRYNTQKEIRSLNRK